MNIITRQALKLINERDFTIEDAVGLAYKQQKEKGFIVEGELTPRADEYSKLSPEMRQRVRKKIEKSREDNGDIGWDDFLFKNGKVLFTKQNEIWED